MVGRHDALLSGDTYPLEGDVFFELDALRCLSLGDADNIAAVAPFSPAMEGSAVVLTNNGYIAELRMKQTVANPIYGSPPLFRTMNLIRFSGEASADRPASQRDHQHRSYQVPYGGARGLQMASLRFGAVASIALIRVLAPRLSLRALLAAMALQLLGGITVYALIDFDLPADISTVALSISSFAIGVAWTISQSLLEGACLQLLAQGAAATAIRWYLTSSYMGFALASPLWRLVSQISLTQAFAASAAVAAISAVYYSIGFPTIERKLSSVDGTQEESWS